MLVAATASAAVPDATLASFGLGGMQQMTDAQGLNVRGMGFAKVSGGGFTYVDVSGSVGSATVTLKAGQGNQYIAANGGSGTNTVYAISGSISAVGIGIFNGAPVGAVVGAISIGGGYAVAK
jgi:hypothetical protein